MKTCYDYLIIPTNHLPSQAVNLPDSIDQRTCDAQTTNRKSSGLAQCNCSLPGYPCTYRKLPSSGDDP